MGLAISTARDAGSGAAIVSLDGQLTFADMGGVRTALRKCAAECPTGIIVDLAGLDTVAAATVSVFATATRHAMRDWGVPVLLCAPRPDVAAQLASFRTLANVHESRSDALRALRDWAPRWLHQQLSPTPISAALARNLVGDACLAWSLPHLCHRARLIVSELASNAIEHASSEFDLTVALSGLYLRIAVQDRSLTMPRLITDAPPDPAAPLADRGRGLQIVTDTAARWGALPLGDGKVVWALLSTHTAPTRNRRASDRPTPA